jgi:hypothetical protein
MRAPEGLHEFASGGAAEAELTRLLNDPAVTANQLHAAERKARATSIGGHRLADRVDALVARARAKAGELER